MKLDLGPVKKGGAWSEPRIARITYTSVILSALQISIYHILSVNILLDRVPDRSFKKKSIENKNAYPLRCMVKSYGAHG